MLSFWPGGDSFKLAVLVTGIAHLRQKVFPLVAWRQCAVREDAAHAHYTSSEEEKTSSILGFPPFSPLLAVLETGGKQCTVGTISVVLHTLL